MKRLSTWMLGAGLAFIATLATGQAFPEKPIKLIVGYSPGGGADTVSRILAKQLSVALGQSVVVENKPGGDAILATALVANAPPNGYTLLFTSSSHTINPALGSKLPYDTLLDFAPVSHIAEQQLMLVANPDRPYRTVPELLAYMRANPGKVNFGSSSTGTALPAELFKLETRTTFVHVPYKGTGPVIVDTLAGHVDLTLAGVASAIEHVKAGRLRALAVCGKKRMPLLPDTPTVAESVPGFNASTWSAVFAPAKTPRAVIDKLNAEIVRIVRTPEFANALSHMGVEVIGSSPEELGRFVAAEMAMWSRVVKETGFRRE